MPVLKMDSNKNLSLTSRSSIYEGEHKADALNIILPKYIRDKDITECIVNLNIINSDNLGDIVDISNQIEEYNENFYIYKSLLENTYTHLAGILLIWIEVLDKTDGMVAKTNPIKIAVREHPSIEDFIPEQQLTLLVQWQKDVNNIYGDMQKLHTDTKEYVQQASDAAVSAKLNVDEINILYANIKEILPDAEVLGRHIGDTSNPHKVNAKDIGLGNVDNTSDEDKPISKATQKALDDIGVQIGDISTALESIDALQESYIGGEQ